MKHCTQLACVMRGQNSGQDGIKQKVIFKNETLLQVQFCFADLEKMCNFEVVKLEKMCNL